MALLCMSIVLRGICKRQPMPMAQKSTAHRIKVGNLFNDPDRKLRKYLQGGKIEQSGEWRFKYDKDGQLIEKYKGSGKWWDSKRERWQYEWNQNGTLKAVKSPHRKRPAQFTYDALGRRICKFASEYTHWVWNGNVPLHEWNTGQTWKDDGWQYYELDLRTWVFEEESFVPMALLLNGKAYSIVTDQPGTPTEAYNVEGEEVWRRRLDMNGRILEEVYDRNVPYSDRIRIPFLFQGQYYDHETELAYNRFRYYAPELGRYISEDPIRFDSGTTALHSYVEDTTGWIDIFGLAKSHYNGKRGEARAKHDLERSGFKHIRDQVVMMVNGKRIIADFVAEDGHGKVHVFEVKFGSGRLTENQKSSQAYRRGQNAHANTSKSGGGAIKTSVRGQGRGFTEVGKNHSTIAEFHILRYS